MTETAQDLADAETAPFTGANHRPFDLAKQSIDDLFEEATAWLDGAEIASPAEAEGVEKLLKLTREAKSTADEARKTENVPFDTGKAEVQARYNPILKRADTITDGCKAVLAPWRAKIEREKAEVAAAARAEADRLAAEAQAAIRASAGNVLEREYAEELLETAKEAEKFATRRARAAVTGNALRTSYVPVLVDLNAAVRHYWANPTIRSAFEEMVTRLATNEVRYGARSIPGFEILEEKKAI